MQFMYYMQWNYDKTYIAKSYKFAERSMIRNRLFTFRDDLFARTLSLVFQFTINHIHTYKGPIKISEKQFYSWFAFSWVWEICSEFNAIVKIEINGAISSKKVSFLQSINNELNTFYVFHSKFVNDFGHILTK